MFEAKVAMMTWPRALRITCSIVSMTTRSEGVLPARLDADRVGEERQHALVAEPAQPPLVGRRPITGVGIELEVGGVDDRADRRVDRDRVGVRDRVGDVDELGGKRPS